MKPHLFLTFLWLASCFFTTAPLAAQSSSAAKQLEQLIADLQSITTPTKSKAEYEAAAANSERLLEQAKNINTTQLNLDEQIDLQLAIATAKKNIFEIRQIALFTVNPVSYFQLNATNQLFVRPGAIGNKGVRQAIRELQLLPQVLANGKINLQNPARTWTENAIYQAYYAKLLLQDSIPQAVVYDPQLKSELVAAAKPALAAVTDFEQWLTQVLLPRSNRSPAWRPEEIEFYQYEYEFLDDFGVDAMLEIAEKERTNTLREMEALAKRLHSEGNLREVWERMKEEAPAWEEVMPMAEKFVEMTANWLQGPGKHLVSIPDFDYGVQITAPMGRRVLSFGGATYGPTVAGRLSGYYVITPLEDILSPEEKESRLKSYNPYWTHVISYHEWLGHTVQRAAAGTRPQRPMRQLYNSAYLSQAWSFYLERLLEEEGYFEDVLDHTTALKTRMGRLQMRMWRIQRILTKLKMAKGTQTFEEAVQAYINEIGMEPTNAFIEVQRDCQTPSPPGREIIGELYIVQLREHYKQRMGIHYNPRSFHDQFLSYGDLPLPIIKKLMFGEE